MMTLTERTTVCMSAYIQRMAKAETPEQVQNASRDAILLIQSFAKQCEKDICTNNQIYIIETNNNIYPINTKYIIK